jgi:plastocyanin
MHPPTTFAARLRTIGVGAALAIGSFAGFAPAPLVAATGGAATWHVQAGNLDSPVPPIADEFTAFYPARITVHAGDDVLFSPVGGHTVTFNPVRIPGGPPTFAYGDPTFGGFRNNPLRLSNQPGGEPLNSGEFSLGGPPPPPGSPPPPPTSYTLKIDGGAAGARGVTYQYFCMFHREMSGWVTVLPAAAELPSTDAENQRAAQRSKKADLARATHLLASATRDAEDTQVAAGLGAPSVQGAGAGAINILRFAPPTLEINVGQSVTWINKDINAPHTVTFGAELPGPPGAPPGFLPYGGSIISSPTGQVNSGFLISQELIDYVNAGSLFPPGFVVTRRVTFTFTKAGVYPYTCALHDDFGMLGTIIVRNQEE